MYHHNLGLLFNAVAQEQGSKAALLYTHRTLSFESLHSMAVSLAAELLRQGFVQGDVMAIAHTKQPASYALMLAGLMLGVPYVCIDIDSPAVRTARILRTSEPKALFYDHEDYAEHIETLRQEYLCESFLLGDFAPPNSQELQQIQEHMHKVDGATLAYIMFTSGSTGNPKGVAITHENLTHFIAWGQRCFSIESQDIFAQISPMYFDNSVFDFYTGLFNGASLAPIPKSILTAPLELVAHIEAMQCTIWFSVPSLLMYLMTMKVLTSQRLPSIRSFSFGGEGYPKVELKKLFDAYASRARIVNVYGPTECTCICSAYPLSADDFTELEGLPTLGQLNENFDYLILDEQGQEASLGELCLIGPNVAAGYFNDAERTQNSFLTLNTPNRYGKRMYKTGDIVEEKGGNLYFVGRKDNQIKHMGYRIELEEIEHALISLAHINQAAVIYERTQALYGRILAYVASDCTLESADILEQIKSLLPAYMIPSKVCVLPSLPKNANGKVDKQALLQEGR